MIKTFRGILADGEQQRIRLSTKKGKVGYKIINLQGFPNLPGSQSTESVVSLWKVKQTSVATTNPSVDFSDGNLLACLYQDQNNAGDRNVTIFEQEIFNQDIYITHSEAAGSQKFNYYVELETMPLTDNAAAVSTLRDIRLNPQVGA